MTSTKPTFVRERPSGFDRIFFRAPVMLYKGPLADLMNWRHIMLLTTTGRKSGLPRTTGVTYMPLDGRYLVLSSFGVRSNWYRNLLANPEVIIQVGRRKMRATAKPVEDPARRRELAKQYLEFTDKTGPPPFLRPLFRLARILDYDQEVQTILAHGETLPFVELVPHSEV